MTASGAEVAGRLRALAGAAELHGRGEELEELAQVLEGGETADAADAWAEADLLAMFAREDAFEETPPQRRRLRWLTHRRLTQVSSALVFVPLLCTWGGISLAADAYADMLNDPRGREAAAGRGFLELWQAGFDGRLLPAARLGWVAAFAFASIALLVLVSSGEGLLRELDERSAAARRARLVRELVTVLGRAQIVLNRRRLGSPARFAGELSAAARELGDLASRNARASTGFRESADRIASASRGLERTGRTVKEVTGELGRIAAELISFQKAAHQVLQEAAATLDAGSARFSEGVAEATRGLVEAGDGFAAGIAATGERAARDIGGFYQEAVAAAAIELEERMAGLGDQLAGAAKDITAAVDRLAAAVAAAEADGPGPRSH